MHTCNWHILKLFRHFLWGFLADSVAKNPPANGKVPWRRKWQPTPVFLPGKSHGQRTLEHYNPWGCRELDMTEHSRMKVTTLLINWNQKDLGPRPGKWLKLPECWPSTHATEPGVAKMPWADKAQCDHGVSTQSTRAQSEGRKDTGEEVPTRVEFHHHGWSERTQFLQDILLHPSLYQGPTCLPGV